MIDGPSHQDPSLKQWERVLVAILLLLALVTRFYMLEVRAISHDESIHTKFSWNLYAGQGFQHNPMMHGPLLFELTALSYHIFGPDDFASRIVPALVGVALVMAPFLFRRWLSPFGAAATSFLLLISPSISYYSRYIRHDVLLMLSAVLLLWVMLRYLETGAGKWLGWLAASFSIMYATKEASYFYTAIFGVLFLIPFAARIMKVRWSRSDLRSTFFGLLVAMVVLGGVFVAAFAWGQVQEMALDAAGNTQLTTVTLPLWGQLAAGLALVLGGIALVVAVRGIGRQRMRTYRLFDLLMVLGTLTLPLGSAFVIKFAAGVDMQIVYDAVRTGNFAAVPTGTVVALFAVVLGTLAVSAGFGLWWDRRRWPWIALIHYTIFFVLYTTLFTWGFGAISGLVGGLAYWLAQHGVERGNQPGYYYLLIGSLYEYLPILLSIVGGVAALRSVRRSVAEYPSPPDADLVSDPQLAPVPPLDLERFFPALLLGWTLISWVAYSYAGEKMPWLMVHIALPSIFLAGWWIGQFVEQVSWSRMLTGRGWVLALFLPLFVASATMFLTGLGQSSSALGAGIPSAGPRLAQLRPMGATLGGLIGMLALGMGGVWLVRDFVSVRRCHLVVVMVGVFLTALTLRTMVMVNYVNYDLATEFLVYAHGAPDIKVALERIEQVSWHLHGTAHDVRVAYGEDGSWPFTWYMVSFPNNYFYGTTPDATRLLASPVVIAGSPQYGAVEDILGDDYIATSYIYLWWPIQDYFGLTWERVRNAVSDPAMRGALWDIVWRRDYRRYAQLKNPSDPFDLASWPYRKDFRLYVRRDVVAESWPLTQSGSGVRHLEPVATEPPDQYAAGSRELPVIGEIALPNATVRGMAVAGDGTLFVADTLNHRIWHVDHQNVLGSFGGYGAGLGQLNEPWGVAIDAMDHIYVADTWNHRIQKFSYEGEALTAWGSLAQVVETGVPGTEGRFYGPRGVAAGPNNELYVADTGNKRVQVFDLDGNFLREFGGGGSAPGRLDEPVGIAVGDDGEVAVADTWNRRIQVFASDGTLLRRWQVPSWDISHPDEKPFLTWGNDLLLVTDPLRGRVLAFDASGAYRWTLANSGEGRLSFPVDVALDADVLYVTDAHSGRLIRYALP